MITDDRLMINDYTADIFNCCFEPAYTIEHIVEAMKKLAGCGYKFKWSFEEALEDWFNDNGRKGLI